MTLSSTTFCQPTRSAPLGRQHRVVHGRKLPEDRLELAANERAWITSSATSPWIAIRR